MVFSKKIFYISRGFTLLEVLMVAVIIAITASIASVSYRKAIKKASAKEAEAQVELIYDAEARYALENNDDIVTSSIGLEGGLSDLGISPNQNSPYFEYGVSGSDIDDIEITGRAKGSSKYDGVEVKYNKNGADEICVKLKASGSWACKER